MFLKPKLNVRAVRAQMLEREIYTFAELAQRLDVTKAALSYWIREVSFPNEKNLTELAKVLDCPWEDLVIFPKETAPPGVRHRSVAEVGAGIEALQAAPTIQAMPVMPVT